MLQFGPSLGGGSNHRREGVLQVADAGFSGRLEPRTAASIQTDADLMAQGFDVTVVADAVSSRTERNRQIALTRLVAEGAHISSTEMALFELLKTAQHPQFKPIARLVK